MIGPIAEARAETLRESKMRLPIQVGGMKC